MRAAEEVGAIDAEGEAEEDHARGRAEALLRSEEEFEGKGEFW